jgi:hypothetical protein
VNSENWKEVRLRSLSFGFHIIIDIDQDQGRWFFESNAIPALIVFELGKGVLNLSFELFAPANILNNYEM